MTFYRIAILPALILLITACNAPGFRSDDEDAIRSVMTAQEQAWNSGDIHSYMEGYSDTICFIGSKGMTCGLQEVTANYLKSYPDRDAMGELHFGITEVVGAGANHAWVTGTWALHRQADTLGGGFSLLWAREQDEWRIVRDHSF